MNTLNRTIDINIQPINVDAQVYDEDSSSRELQFVIGKYVDTGGGTTKYSELTDKPKINNIELVGNKTAAQLGLQTELTIDATPTEDSTNPVQSGGVYEALNTLIPRSSLFGGFITDAATSNPGDIRRYFLTLLDGELPNFEIYDLPDNGKWKIVRWNPRDAGWDYETIDCYTSDQIDFELSMMTTALSNKQDTISDLATIRSGAAAGATAVQPSTLATVATSGSYSDLTNKPSINGVTLQGNKTTADLENRQYNTTTGKLGYKILKPGLTFASQVTEINTIYEIRDVFDLSSGSVTIPAGCKLRFEGGRVINGTITGNNTIIEAEPYQIFDTDTTLSGSFLNDCMYAEWFGAKADGTMDNYAVFQYVFNTSIRIGVPIQLIEGTYVIDECPAATDRQTLNINFTQDAQSFVLLGMGMDKTTIKSADGWLDRLYSKHDSGSASDNDIMRQKKLIYYYRNNNWVAALIKICDITLNRNASSNTVTPPSDYAWEGQGIITSAKADGYTGTAKNFVYKNLFIKDRVSTGIGFGNAKCDSVLIDGIKSDRQIYISGVREEIYPLVQCTNTIIRNCDVQFIQIEPISTQTGNRNTTIENCYVDSIEWNDNNRSNVLSIKNCTLNNTYLNVSGTTLNIDGCSFYYTDSAFGQNESNNTFISGKEVNITNCVFYFTPNENYVCKKITIGNDTERKSIVTFKNCSFISETINRFNMIEGYYRYQAETAEANADVTFDDCYFSWNSDMTTFDGSGYLIKCIRGMNATLKNCVVKRLSNTNLFYCGGLSSGFGSLTLNNLKIIGEYGYEKIISVQNTAGTYYKVDIKGEYDYTQFFRVYNSSANYTTISKVTDFILDTNDITTILSIAQKAYIPGTKIKYGNLLYEYVSNIIGKTTLSIDDFRVTPINEVMTQVEIDAINTTYLPTNSPVKVFNSTLGKYVMWYGNAWIDCTDISGKADKVVYVDASTPQSTMDANKVYQYGTLSGNTTFPAFTAVPSGDTEVKIWCWTFTTPSTAPTITWPAGITSWAGGSAPTINASKSYEVSVMDGFATIIEN